MKTSSIDPTIPSLHTPTASGWRRGLSRLLAALVLWSALSTAHAQTPGSLDGAFNPSVNSDVRAVAFQSDGKIIIAGEGITQVNGVSRINLARLNADGTLDTGFNASVSGTAVYAVVVQPDGKIVLGGVFTQVNGVACTNVARLNADGSLDTGFNASAGENNNTYSGVSVVAVQQNGKVLLGGGFTQVNGATRNHIARLNADGSSDPGFDGQGSGIDNTVFDLAVQADGKIVLGGAFSQINGLAHPQIARLNADGTLDSGFSASAGAGTHGRFVEAVALQPDGKILLGGDFTQVNGVSRTNLARLNANGSLDASFNPTTDDVIYDVALQANGRIVLGGVFTQVNGIQRSRLGRVNADGSLDTNFNANADAGIFVVAVQPSDAKILLGGFFTQVNGVAHLNIARVFGGSGNANGAPVITSASSASGKVGQPFSFQVTATNSPTGYATSGLPPGLSINPTTGLISGTPTQAGITFLTLSATNAAGTGSAQFSVSITVPQPPVITSATNASAQVGQPFTYTISATNSPTSYGASGLPTGLGVNPATGLISGTPTAAGTFTVALSATNAGGTGAGTLNLAVTTAPVPPPVIIGAVNASGQVGQPFSYGINATNSPTGFGAAGLPAGLGVNPATGLISGTPTAAGTFNVALSATNAGGTGAATLALTISAAALQPPVITSTGSATAQVGQPFTYQIAGSNGPTSFNATGLPAGLSVNPATGLISGTPATTGTFIVALSATNAGGTGMGTLSLTITTAPVLPPVITSAGGANGLVGQPFTFRVTASNNPTAFTATGLPAGLSLNPVTGFVTGTPGQAGIFSVALSVTNAGGTGMGTLTLVVSIPLLPPALTSATSIPATVGQPFNYQLTATNAPTAFGTTQLPAGLALNPATGLISGTPAQAGILQATLSAANAAGTGTLVVAFNVAATPPPPPSSGGVSPTFNPGAGTDGQVRAVAFLPDRRAFIAGAFTSYQGVPRRGIVRVNADGSLDSSFNPGSGTDQPVNALLLQADGKLVLGGEFTVVNGVARNLVARLNADGSVDTTFDARLPGAPSASTASAAANTRHDPSFLARRWPTTRAKAGSGSVDSLAHGPNGTLDVGGTLPGGVNGALEALKRLANNGTPDPNFPAANGKPNGTVRVTVTQPDGKTVIGGDFSAVGNVPRGGLARLNEDGSLDPSFDPGPGAQGGPVDTLALQPDDGSIVLGGDFTSVDNQRRGRIARVRSNGRVDPGFDPGSGANGTVRTLALQTDGKVVVGGAFTQIADAVRNAIARLNADGSPDKTFDPGSGANGTVNDIDLGPDGNALLGGDFTQVNNKPAGRVAQVGAGEAPPPVGSVVVSVVGAGPTRGGFVVSRTGSVDAPVTVFYHNGGSAARDVDYVALPGSVTLGAGQGETVIPVQLLPGANRAKKVKVILDPSPAGDYGIAKTQSKVFLSDLP